MPNTIYSSEKYHFVYKTTNIINKKFYIGKHSTFNLEDGYLGSGKYLNSAIKKYGRENFIREIIKFCNSETDALAFEKSIITKELVDNNSCYNLTHGGYGSWCHINSKIMLEETKRKISKSLKGRTLTKSHKQKVKDNHHNCSGSNNSFYGKTHSLETRAKLRAADYTSRKGAKEYHGNTKGSKWYHDENGKSYMLFPNDNRIIDLNLIEGKHPSIIVGTTTGKKAYIDENGKRHFLFPNDPKVKDFTYSK